MTAASFMFQSVYPGTEGMKTYIKILNFIVGTIGLENPTYLLWVLVTTAVFLEYYIPIFSIGFGGFILPFNERDGKELILTQKQSIFSYYIENIWVVTSLIFLSILPSYFIICFDLLRNNASDSIPNITTIFFLTFLVSIFFALLSGLGGILFFSRSISYFIGGLYFFFSVIIGVINNVVDIGAVSDLSLISRINLIQNGLDNTVPIDASLEIIFLILLIIIISLVTLSKNDFIKRQSIPQSVSQNENFEIKNIYKRILITFPIIKNIIGVLCIVCIILFSIIPFLAWTVIPAFNDTIKYVPLLIYICLIVLFFIYEPMKIIVKHIRNPILTDQLNVLHWIFSLSVLAITIVFIYLFVIYPGDQEIGQYMNSFQSPIITGPMFNHSVQSNINGFIAIEIFAFTWMYYGPLLLISTNSIALRDYNNVYSEITFCLSQTQRKIYFWRFIGGLIYFLILIIINTIGLILVEFAFNYETKIVQLIVVFSIVIVSYIVFLLFFTTLILLVPNRMGQKMLILSFFYSIAIIILAFTLKNADWLRFFSPFGYFDYVGIFYFSVPLIDTLVQITFFIILVALLFFFTLDYRVPRKDLI